MTDRKRMPFCLGLYEAGDRQCDGDPRGKTTEERVSCAYRDRCVGFIQLQKESGRPRDFFVYQEKEGKEEYSFPLASDFADKLNRQITRFSIKNGRAARHPAKVMPRIKRKHSPEASEAARAAALKRTKAQRMIGPKANIEAMRKARDVVTELAQWFLKQACTKLEREIARVPDEALNGDLLLLDRSKASGYQGLYCRSDGKRQPICTFYYRPITSTLEVRIACSVSAFNGALSKDEQAKLKPEDFSGKDGAFKVRIRNVDAERASIIAETFQRMLKSGDLSLPKRRSA